MEMPSDTVLAANGLVRNEKSNEIYCSICATDKSLKAWEKHIVDPTHLETLEQFNLIFEKVDSKFHCKLCSATIDWQALKCHARSHMMLPWHRPDDKYDKYKIFFENLIVEWKTLFHCCICDATFSKWDVVFVHITDPTHQSRKEKTALFVYEFSTDAITYEFLVSEGIIASDETTLECRICGGTKVDLNSVGRHVKGLIHKINKPKFHLEFTDREAKECITGQTYENLQTEELPSEDSCSEESTTEKVEAGTSIDNRKTVRQSSPCNYVVKKGESDSYCIICNCIMFNHSVNNHIKDKGHVDAEKEYGCDEISLISGSEYHCKVCGRKLCGLANVYSHVMGSKHSKTLMAWARERNQKRPNEVKTIKQPKEVVKGVSKAEGNYNAESMEKNIHDNISLVDNNVYYCRCCNIVVPGPENIYLHLKEKRHLHLLSISEKQVSKILEKIDTGNQFDEVSELAYQRSPYYYYLVKLNSSDFRCTVCDCIVSALPININIHVTGNCHTESLKRYGCDNISLQDDNSYHCRCCALAIPSLKEVHLHIKTKSHLTFLNLSERQQVQMQPDRFESLRPNVNLYTEEERLLRSPNTFGKEQVQIRTGGFEPPKRSDDNLHTTEGSHLSFLKTSRRKQIQTRLCCLKIPRKPNVNLHTREEVHQRKPVAFRIPQRPEPIPEPIFDRSSCNYLVRLNDTNFLCKICDCNISASSSNINIHVIGNYHSKSLKKYGCNYISLKGDNTYYCECCDVAIVHLENVYLHIKEGSHMNIVTVLNRQQVQQNESSWKKGAEVTELAYDFFLYDQQLQAKAKTSEDVEITQQPKSVIQSASQTSSLVYILKHNATDSHCKICDIKLFGCTEIEDHIAGEDHAAAMEKHGCDSIVSEGGDAYYCTCCKCNISGCQNVCSHVIGRRHFFGLQNLTGKQQLQTAKRNLNELKTSEKTPELKTALSSVSTEISKIILQLKRRETKSRRNRTDLE